jgi:hypothetical protein
VLDALAFERLAVHQHAPGRRPVPAEQQPDQAGLAGTGSPDDGDVAACLDG